MQIIYQAAAKTNNNFFTVSLHHLPVRKQNFLHYHDVLELGVCLEGDGLCLTEKASIPYQKGDAQCILPFEPHYNVTQQNGTLWMFINIDLLRLSSQNITYDPLFIDALIKKIPSGGVFKDKTPAADAIKEITTLIQSEDQDTDLLALKIVLLLKMLGSDKVENTSLTKNKSILPALHLVSSYVKKGLRPTPKAMADACFMSESYFRKIFTTHIGEAPKSYITRMQMQQAATMLMNEQTPITDIATYCGFTDFSTFYRNFKAVYGVSPSNYRAGVGL